MYENVPWLKKEGIEVITSNFGEGSVVIGINVTNIKFTYELKSFKKANIPFNNHLTISTVSFSLKLCSIRKS